MRFPGLPALERLTFFCDTMTPRYLAFVSQCKTLKSLGIHAGYSDDSTAKIIGESKTITSVSLGQDCFMSDSGIDLLCKNRNLEWVSVGGTDFRRSRTEDRTWELPRLSSLTVLE